MYDSFYLTNLPKELYQKSKTQPMLRDRQLSKQRLFRVDQQSTLSLTSLNNHANFSGSNVDKNNISPYYSVRNQPFPPAIPIERKTKQTKTVAGFLFHIYKNFSDYTSLEGFRELYNSKSRTWKVIWFCAIGAAIGLSLYQVNNSYQSYKKQRTITTIEPLSADVTYPPISICYYHFFLWVQWDMGIRLGFDKASMLYGLSFLSEVVTEMSHDQMANVKFKFETTMQYNNFSSLMHFYKAVSPESPPGISVLYLNWTVWNKRLDPAYGWLCYQIDNDTIHKGLNEMYYADTNSDDTLELYYNYSYFVLAEEFISMEEYKLYIHDIVNALRLGIVKEKDIDSLNLTNLRISPAINIDNIRSHLFYITEEMFAIQIRLAATLHKWLNNPERPCTKTKYRHYDYCDQECKWLEIGRLTSNTSCVDLGGARLTGLNDMNKICRFDIRFLSHQGVWPGNRPQGVQEINRTGENFIACVKSYCAIPCVDWKYGNTMTIIPVPTELSKLILRTLINVQYPKPHAILVLTELHAQTWESSIGEVGGICGLWLGASVMSLLQLVYLCCCSQCDEKVAKLSERKKRR